MRFASEQALRRLLTVCFTDELVAASATHLASGRSGAPPAAAAVVAAVCGALGSSTPQAWSSALSGECIPAMLTSIGVDLFLSMEPTGQEFKLSLPSIQAGERVSSDEEDSDNSQPGPLRLTILPIACSQRRPI